jgi:hypothetical protein
MNTVAAIAVVSSGSFELLVASRWKRLNSLQKIALLSLISPTVLFGIIYFS